MKGARARSYRFRETVTRGENNQNGNRINTVVRVNHAGSFLCK